MEKIKLDIKQEFSKHANYQAPSWMLDAIKNIVADAVKLACEEQKKICSENQYCHWEEIEENGKFYIKNNSITFDVKQLIKMSETFQFDIVT